MRSAFPRFSGSTSSSVKRCRKVRGCRILGRQRHCVNRSYLYRDATIGRHQCDRDTIGPSQDFRDLPTHTSAIAGMVEGAPGRDVKRTCSGRGLRRAPSGPRQGKRGRDQIVGRLRALTRVLPVARRLFRIAFRSFGAILEKLLDGECCHDAHTIAGQHDAGAPGGDRWSRCPTRRTVAHTHARFLWSMARIVGR